jgi:hypothetical protein
MLEYIIVSFTGLENTLRNKLEKYKCFCIAKGYSLFLVENARNIREYVNVMGMENGEEILLLFL